MNIKNNINNFSQNLPAGCKLIVVSKTQPVEKVKEAYDAGQRIFGENKVQELVLKHEALPADIEWHLIGHLQTNKVKQVVPFVSLIHSVDSEKLIAEIDRQGAKVGKVVRCLLQVHIAKEETKFGFDPEELESSVASGQLLKYPNVAVVGLMGMATLTGEVEKIRLEFRDLRGLFDRLKSQRIQGLAMLELSMGMSSDYEIALEEGSTLVRIGTSIFGT